MKNIIDICKDFGIEIPADKHADFLKAVNVEYRTIAEHSKVLDKLNTATKRAETAEEALKGLEGIDPAKVKDQLEEANKKVREAQEAAQKQIEERDFNDALKSAITEAKGKNAKAIMALLDLEKLRGSKNQDKDIKTALETVMTNNEYLFESAGGPPARFDDPGNKGKPTGAITMKEIMAIKDPVERQRKIGQNLALFGRKGE